MTALKTSLTSLDILAVVRELSGIIKGFYLDNLYQLAPKMLLLKFRSHQGSARVIIEAGRRLNLTSYEYRPPKKPSQLSLAFRKYLRGSRLICIRQYDFDRIIIMVFEGKEGRYELHVELFGDGNLILVDSQGIIKHALRQKRMKDRTIAPGVALSYPPKRGVDLNEVDAASLVQLLKSEKSSLAALLVKNLNVPKELVNEACLRAGVNKDGVIAELSDGQVSQVISAMRKIIEEVEKGELKPNTVSVNGKLCNVLPIDFMSISGEKTFYGSFNEAVDDYFLNLYCEEMKSKRSAAIFGEAERLKAVVRQQEEKIKEYQEKADYCYKIGNLILSNLSVINNILSTILEMRRRGLSWSTIIDGVTKAKQEGAAQFSPIVSLVPSEGTITLKLNGQEVKLNLTSPASQQAQEYFHQAKEFHRKLEGAKEALSKTKDKLRELRKTETSVEQEVAIYRLPKKEWFEKFRWFKSSDGLLVIAGRDSSQNEVLVRKYLSPTDIFMHTVTPGGPVVIIKASDVPPPENTLMEAAQFAASYSKAWAAKLSALEVFWVRGEQVSLSPPPGEYLAKGAFMVYGSRNFLKGVKLEVAVGLVVKGNACRIVYGPPSAVANQTDIYVKLAPGGLSSGHLAKLVKKALAEKVGDEALRRFIDSIPLERVQEALPPGNSKLVSEYSQRTV